MSFAAILAIRLIVGGIRRRQRQQRREAEAEAAAAAAATDPVAPAQIIVIGGQPTAIILPGTSQTYSPPGVAETDPPPAYSELPLDGHKVTASADAKKASEARVSERCYFFIVNEANGSVLEVKRGQTTPETPLTASKRREEKPAYQLWYIDEKQVLRSKLNDFAIERTENSKRLTLKPYTGDSAQQWTIEDNCIVNYEFLGHCLGLKEDLTRLKEDVYVVSSRYEGKPHQHWRIEYI